MEEGCIKGDRAIVVGAREREGLQRQCMCKFITTAADFDREMQLHELLPEPSCIPGGPQFCPSHQLSQSRWRMGSCVSEMSTEHCT